MEEVTYLTPKEIARRYRITERTVRNAIRRGTLPAIRVEAQYRVTEDAVRQWAREVGADKEELG